MDLNLLAREDKYRKLNEELEKRTKSLMDELEMATKKITSSKERGMSEGDCHRPKSADYVKPEDCRSTNKAAGAAVHRPWTGDDDPKNHTKGGVPIENADGAAKSVEPRTCNESMIKVLTTKLQMIQKEFRDLQENYVEKSNECRELQTHIRKNNEDVDGLLKTLKSKSMVKERVETSLTSANRKIEVVESENKTLKREIDALSSELKRLKSSRGKDVRLNRTMETAASLKTALKKSLESQRLMKEEQRRKEEQMTRSLIAVEKQKQEIVSAFRKQLALIANLKKQNRLKDVVNLSKFSEGNFMKILEGALK